MGFARELADMVCFLDQGRSCEEGSAEAVLDRPQQARTQAFLSRVL
jgi:polar amino acid transport system ATP-binding protein